MMGIDTEFSNLDDNEINQILEEFGLEEIGAYVRLWTDTVQIDGDLSLKELQALVAIMQRHLEVADKQEIQGNRKIKTLTLTDREIEYLYGLVYREDQSLKNDRHYPIYSILHSTRDKLYILVTEINEEEIRMRDKYEGREIER